MSYVMQKEGTLFYWDVTCMVKGGEGGREVREGRILRERRW